ncbi:hypothetical protein SAMN05216266_113148 [Amycolatopsis marina]|uniref:Uncharacterized protein n=1 Tax=Amycolatopsis marina TaxID=490629 RepID=A0A1I1BDN0_9PSEU|nr:hypothetical protein [Amycolatopsis marina]SFB48485.1 hypothetical protein SAMN05216266_113148 [Amycolatopsis marina]
MTFTPESDAFRGFPPMDNQNVASEGAYVEQQVGVQYGDSTFHHHESVYNFHQGDSPERKHDVGLNHLAGGTPRFAEKIFGSLLWDGHATTERAYYYLLSVLSDRSLHEIHGDLLTGIVDARKICCSLQQDGWRNAFDMVWRLLRYMRHEVDDRLDGGGLQDALDAFGSLPDERQYEITRHLDMVLGGVIQERLEAAQAHHVVTKRMQVNRRSRAWKFFEQDPARPRRFAAPAKKAEQGDWGRALVGGFFVLLGVAALFAGRFSPGVVLGVLLLAAGGYLVVVHGSARESLTLRYAAKLREVSPPAHPLEARSPGHWVSTDFVREVHRLVDVRFSEARPHIAGNWPAYTEGVRAHLKRRFVDLYGNAQVVPGAISWLIRWHARRVAAGWTSEALFQFRSTLALPARTKILFRVGVGIAVVGLLALLGGDQGSAAVLIGAGGFFAAKGTVRVLGLRKADEIGRAEAEQLFKEEMRGYEEWLKVLADRPTDAEMARWLALDKIYLKTDVVKRAGLTSHDLVEHVVMTEGAKDAMRARVPHGPPRYSSYMVQIFLLTSSGVREARVELDFLTGEAKNERRNLFQYNALASATVTESGMRTTKGEGPQTEEVERLRSRTFRLSLVNGQHLTVVAENFRSKFDDTLENESELFLVALQSSGIESALPILESVAAEGAEWITREQERRRRWSRDWSE